MLEVLKALEEVMGMEVKVKFVGGRSGHERRCCMTTKLRYEVTPLKEGLRKTVEWYLYNR